MEAGDVTNQMIARHDEHNLVGAVGPIDKLGCHDDRCGRVPRARLQDQGMPKMVPQLLCAQLAMSGVRDNYWGMVVLPIGNALKRRLEQALLANQGEELLGPLRRRHRPKPCTTSAT